MTQPVRSRYDQSAPITASVTTAFCRFVRVVLLRPQAACGENFVCVKVTPVNLALSRIVPVRSAKFSVAAEKSAPVRLAPARFAELRFAFGSLAPDRFVF